MSNRPGPAVFATAACWPTTDSRWPVPSTTLPSTSPAAPPRSSAKTAPDSVMRTAPTSITRRSPKRSVAWPEGTASSQRDDGERGRERAQPGGGDAQFDRAVGRRGPQDEGDHLGDRGVQQQQGEEAGVPASGSPLLVRAGQPVGRPRAEAGLDVPEHQVGGGVARRRRGPPRTAAGARSHGRPAPRRCGRPRGRAGGSGRS